MSSNPLQKISTNVALPLNGHDGTLFMLAIQEFLRISKDLYNGDAQGGYSLIAREEPPKSYIVIGILQDSEALLVQQTLLKSSELEWIPVDCAPRKPPQATTSSSGARLKKSKGGRMTTAPAETTRASLQLVRAVKSGHYSILDLKLALEAVTPK